MAEFNELFEEGLLENQIFPEPLDIGEKVIQKVENEFKGYADEEKSRQDEEKEIQKDIKKLEIQLQKNKNIKNHKLLHVNSQRAEKRKEIKKKIILLKIRLQEIDDERDDNTKRNK